MATALKQIEQATAVLLLSTELNSLLNNTNAVSATPVLVNTVGTSNTDGYVRGKLEAVIGAPAGTLTANSSLNVWFLETVDGTNYEDGDASTTPAREADCVLGVRAVSTAQRITKEVFVPVGSSKVLYRNAGTGQTLASSGNTLKLLLNTDEMV